MLKHSPNAAGSQPGSNPFTLFIPSGTKNYSMRFSLPGHGQQRISLKTSDLDDATQLANRKYWEAVNRAESGLLVKEKTIPTLGADWLSKTTGTAEKVERRKTVITRYLGVFFHSKFPKDLTDKNLSDYMAWRQTYWIDGPGRDITHIEYEREGRKVSRPVTDAVRRVPSTSTMNNEMVVVREFMAHLKEQGFLKDVATIKKISHDKASNRPSFTDEEIGLFRSTLMKRLQASSEQNRHIRFMFMVFCEVMIESGLRDTEALRLKWGDIINFTEDSAIKDHGISLKIHGKSKYRIAIPNPSIINWLQILFKEQKHTTSNDYLFTQKTGNKVISFSKQMNETLEACGLTKDFRNVKRTCYSFRHFYITNALNKGIDIHLLARNTGTSVNMIERHYSHVSLEHQRNRLIHVSDMM